MTQTARLHMFCRGVSVAIAVIAMPGLVHGQLTYHEASPDVTGGNLTAAGGSSAFDAIDLINPGAGVDDDDLWRIRSIDTDTGNQFGANGSVYESSTQEDSPELEQTVSGLGANAMVDVYVVWWSDPGNWSVRAGLNSNPGGNQLYDRLGTDGVAGTLGVFADWAVLPPDNPDIDDGLTGIEGATLEGNRTMLIAKIGTGTADGSGNLPVYIDDNVGGGNRSWFDGIATAPVDSPVEGVVTATVDRTTGNLTISSPTDVSISAVNIASGSGSLNPAAWTSINGNLDGGGNSTFDSDLWETTSMTSQSLAESEVAEPAPTVPGGTFGPSGAGTIDFGNIWTASPFEDINVNLTLTDSEFTVPIAVEFTGGTAQILGDFDNDADIDVDDYGVVLRGLNQDLAGMTDLESYPLGDVNGDQVTDFNDLVAFRGLYDGFNGEGAFEVLTTSIPEPAALALASLAVLGISLNRRGRAVACLLVVLLACCTNSAQAQTITYVDADHNTNTAPESGEPAFPVGEIDDQGTDDDELWGLRAFANGGTIYQNAGFNGADNAHRLVTTIPGLSSGTTYEIYAYFWDDGSGWSINAGLQNDVELPNFAGANSAAAVADDFTNALPVLVAEGNRTMFQAFIGEATAGGNGEIPVFIDDDPPIMLAEDPRTWYDGVGYAVAGPRFAIEVNTTSGEIRIINPTGDPVDFSYYEITSAGNSLSPAGWNSLDAQNLDAVDGSDDGTTAGDTLLEGWDIAGPGEVAGDHDGSGTVDQADLTFWQNEYGNTLGGGDFLDWQRNLGESGGTGGSAGILNETHFLGSSTVEAVTGELLLGNAYDTSVNAEDLVFRFGTVDDGAINLGRVIYVSGAAASSVVPEPSTLAMLAGATLLLVSGKTRRRIA